jgi:hypothetical protein
MRHFLSRALALLLAVVILSTNADAQQRRHHHSHHGQGKGDFSGPEDWSTYVSPEAGTAVEYPANVFSVRDEASERESEARFRTQDGRAKLSVYSLPNEDRESPRSYIQHHLRIDPSRLTYKRITDRFFAISGTRDDLTFYSRCNFVPKQRGKMHCVYLEYPNREERAWDGIVTRISRSLSAPEGQAGGR